MKELKVSQATVVSKDDPDQKGRIQVRVYPELSRVDKRLLPWVRPFLGEGMATDHFSFSPPNVDSTVWVVFLDDYWKNGYWISGQFIDGFFDYTSVKNEVDSIAEMGDTTYPTIRFYRMPNGSIYFSNDSGEDGIFHGSGSYLLFDVNGGSFVYTQGQKTRMYNDNGSMELSANGQINLNSGNLTVDP